jgi:beta-glucanase (GH16 family)
MNDSSHYLQERWSLVWSDEFEVEGKVDATKWKNEITDKRYNAEEQFYMDRDHTASRVRNGKLIIEGRQEYYRGYQYTSARLNSVPAFTYGRFEFRARAPSSPGTWPAIWLLGRNIVYGKKQWPDNGEIDIMEMSSKDSNLVTQSAYSFSDNYFEGMRRVRLTHVPTADSEFHVYALEWLPGRLDYFIDGVNTYTEYRLPSFTWKNWPFDQDMYIIINLAIGGDLGGIVNPETLPAHLEVDYVRVYRPTLAEDCVGI